MLLHGQAPLRLVQEVICGSKRASFNWHAAAYMCTNLGFYCLMLSWRLPDRLTSFGLICGQSLKANLYSLTYILPSCLLSCLLSSVFTSLLLLGWQDGDESVIATKLTGDPNVPAGQISFKAKINRSNKLSTREAYPADLGVVGRYRGHGRIAKAGNKDAR